MPNNVDGLTPNNSQSGAAALALRDDAPFGAVTRSPASAWVPELVAAAGPEAAEAYLEFFTASIRNKNSRLVYARACYQFFHWCAENGLTLEMVRPFHVAAYVERLPGSKPTVKQKLSALRVLYDFLLVRQIVSANPAASVRGPKYVVKRGKTPVWSREDAKKLLESIPRGDLSGLRDRALISVMLYSFARVSAVLALKRQDFQPRGARRWLCYHEKGGKEHEMPAHHQIEEALDEYLAKVEIKPGEPIFQSVTRAGTALTGRALNRHNAWAAIRKRARKAGFLTPVGCHTWRATGVTVYLENGGRLEQAQQMAGHESPRTTKLYDRTRDEITVGEVERIRL